MVESVRGSGDAELCTSGSKAGAESYRDQVDEIFQKVDKLEERVNEIEQFYLNHDKMLGNHSKGSSSSKEKERHVLSIKKQQQDATRREAASAKRMQELMRQFGTILRQIMQHKWAWPFMQPVDVKALGLHDYYEIIERPMDFSTIKHQAEAKDGTGYKNVRDMCADVRLVFSNAMKYNDEGTDVHLMAKTLLEKFEEKWQLLLPKVTEEEKRQEAEEAEAKLDMQVAQEAAQAKIARDITNEVYEVDMHLEKLRETVVQHCRKMSTEEKRALGIALTRLSPEDLTRALEIVAECNPSFHATGEQVELDIDAQSESTLWRLKFFLKDALGIKGRNGTSTGANNKDGNSNIKKKKKKKNDSENDNDKKSKSKRKEEMSDGIIQAAKKKSKKGPS